MNKYMYISDYLFLIRHVTVAIGLTIWLTSIHTKQNVYNLNTSRFIMFDRYAAIITLDNPTQVAIIL